MADSFYQHAAYANIFSPLAFGAAGNGTTDDTTAMQACAAAAAAAKGVMDLGTYTFKTSSPISVASFFHLKGAGYGGGTITNSASDLFAIPSGSCFSVTIENCTLTAAGSGTGGGHVFNASSATGMSQWKLLGVTASQSSTSHCIWFQFGGGWIDCLVDQGCNFSCSGSATISPWTVLNAPGAWNSIKFSRMRCTANGATVPFFNIDPGHGAHTDTAVQMFAASTTVNDASAVSGDLGLLVNSANFPGGTSLITAVNPGAGYTVATPATANLSGQTCLIGTPGFDEDIIFEHITWEVCTGGAIWMTACVDVLISMCAHWDTTATSDIYHFSQAATGYPCRSIIVRGGRCGAVTGSANNFFADSNCTNILIDSFGEWGTPPVISSPAIQTTIINNTVAGTAIPPAAVLPGIAVTGGPQSFTPFSSPTTTGTVALSPVHGSYQRIALTGNVTLAAPTSNQVDGQDLVVELTQPASGGPFTAAWNAAFIFQGGTTAPPLTAAASAVDVFAFRWNATASKWIEQYRRLGYFTGLQAASNLSDLASASTARTNLGIAGLNPNDPMIVGFNANYVTTNVAVQSLGFSDGANTASYMRLTSAGYASSNLVFVVAVSSGNISACYYTGSGSGASAKPTGGQPATSGAVACPAAGVATLALGASYTPAMGDWVAMSCDNSTPATFTCAASGSNTTLSNGLTWVQTTAHPLPATPVPTSGAFSHVLMKGS